MDRLENLWTHGVKQPGWPVGPVAIRLGLILALIALLAGLYLAQASEIATTGRRVQALREQRDELQRENAELLDQIATEGSISRLQDRAARLRFVPATQVEYLRVTAVPSDVAPTMRTQWFKNK
jgi:hypothetical protein